ncbi:hypothetical protein [Catellatospora sp. TT07R-123]|uniref:hypothetical protein n=1 Tax=Catellatospora sp. TT07R-123 TaxID=2733863 RepID=UPI001BB31083|nr:hypothetical protein [Catellatospora sp. TT07R-123]
MAMTFERLRAMSDDEIRAEYDKTAANTSVGLNFWTDELSRRTYERSSAAALEEARAARSLAKWNMVLAGAAILVSVIAIVVQAVTAG